ncbi:MAG: UDP-glucose 4-epimerase, partial [Actinomycetota bacterium]|nr:UDP-glucose 4-epimerase [Actinomycetota bacterium]
MGRRVLVTGLGTFWGGRLAQTLERDPDVDVIVGLDRFEPSIALERTEFVRSDASYSILARIVKAAQIDTILHTFLVVDSTQMSGRTLHEINVIGTMNLLAAASAPDSSVRTVIVKSSSLVYGAAPEDPVWFREETRRSHAPRTKVERSLIEVESYLRDFAEENPHVAVSLLRFCNVLGPDITTPLSSALELPLVPSILGFDPRLQFVHEDDVLRSILFVLQHGAAGVFNVAGDGLIPWSEAAAICGKRLVPLPPVLTNLAVAPLARYNVVDLPPEVIHVLRYGRGVDNRRLKERGFTYRFTSAGAVDSFARASRLRATVGEST